MCKIASAIELELVLKSHIMLLLDVFNQEKAVKCFDFFHQLICTHVENHIVDEPMACQSIGKSLRKLFIFIIKLIKFNICFQIVGYFCHILLSYF